MKDSFPESSGPKRGYALYTGTYHTCQNTVLYVLAAKHQNQETDASKI